MLNNRKIAIELLWFCSIVFVPTLKIISSCSMQFTGFFLVFVTSSIEFYGYFYLHVKVLPISNELNSTVCVSSICSRATFNVSSHQRKTFSWFHRSDDPHPFLNRKGKAGMRERERNINKLCEMRLNKSSIYFAIKQKLNYNYVSRSVPFLFPFILFHSNRFTLSSSHKKNTKWLLNYITWLT